MDGAPNYKRLQPACRALLYQLYTKVPLIRSAVRKAYEEKKVYGTSREWQRRELEDLFSRAVILASKSRSITIFGDALDEAGRVVAAELAAYFHSLNDRFAAEHASTRICISCRHYPILTADASLEICVEDENYDDIAMYVKHELDIGIPKHETMTLTADHGQTLEKSIAERAKGVFQWARLVVPIVIGLYREGESFAYIYNELNDFPEGLDAVYNHILSVVIEPRNRARALHLMQWVCLAVRPLSLRGKLRGKQQLG